MINFPVVVAYERTVPLLWVKVPVFMKLPPTESVLVGKVTEPFVMVKSLVVVAVAPTNDQAPPEPLKTRLLKLEDPGVMVLPLAVAVMVTVPELWVKVPEFEKLLPIERLPLGAVSVPAVMVRLLVAVAFVVVNDHPPQLPLKVRL